MEIMCTATAWPAGFSPRVQLVGISTVAGNQTVDKVTRNALHILEIAGLTHIGKSAEAESEEAQLCELPRTVLSVQIWLVYCNFLYWLQLLSKLLD